MRNSIGAHHFLRVGRREYPFARLRPERKCQTMSIEARRHVDLAWHGYWVLLLPFATSRVAYVDKTFPAVLVTSSSGSQLRGGAGPLHAVGTAPIAAAPASDRSPHRLIAHSNPPSLYGIPCRLGRALSAGGRAAFIAARWAGICRVRALLTAVCMLDVPCDGATAASTQFRGRARSLGLRWSIDRQRDM